MIKKWLIRIAIVTGILIFLGMLTYGQVFNFVLKPFSEECSYTSGLPIEGSEQFEKACSCDGFSFNEETIGSTNTYCLGTCGECTCNDYINETWQEVDCELPIQE
ncbi:hypothetical protein HOA91_00350 [Candidatus Woesearchaeota archaeon]|jgi:hypothetical protein|nr:hypothetical protein [Candidatus Woesearchaeota archaeon]